MQNIRNLQAIDKSIIFPQQVPFSDLQTRETYFEIENFGKTMQTLEDENNTELGKLCRKQVADFVLNLLKMEIEIGDKKLILLDNHAENLTFDQKNGVRLIDLSYKRDLPIFAWNCPEQIRIVFNKMIKNANTGEALTIRRLCTESRYSELTKDQKSLVKIYFESVL